MPEKYVIGRLAAILTKHPFMLHSILIQYFGMTRSMSMYSLIVKLKETDRKLEFKSLDGLFETRFHRTRDILQSFITSEQIMAALSTPCRRVTLIPCTFNFDNPTLNHQCFIVLKGTKALFFDPYGYPLKNKERNYEHVIQFIIEKYFPTHTYVPSNLSNNAQVQLLAKNNKINIVPKIKALKLPAEIEESVLKFDEEDSTIATLHLMDFVDSLTPTQKKRVYELFYYYSSKTCVSLSLIILHQFVFDPSRKFQLTDDYLDYLGNFIDTTLGKVLADLDLSDYEIASIL
jgi:hypothetical protein